MTTSTSKSLFALALGAVLFTGNVQAQTAADVGSYCAAPGQFTRVQGFKGELPAQLCQAIADAKLTPEQIDTDLKLQPLFTSRPLSAGELATRMANIHADKAQHLAKNNAGWAYYQREDALKRAAVYAQLQEVIGN